MPVLACGADLIQTHVLLLAGCIIAEENMATMLKVLFAAFKYLHTVLA